jgi:ABC-type nitrate/sulfonate/bicarbonate transport system substrate-binding protein
MLEHEGFDESEIVLEHIGSAEDRFDAVKAGEVDAIGVLEPYVTLGKYDEELSAVYEGPCRAALVAPAEIDPDQVDAFRTALNRAVADINDDLERYREEYVDLLETAAADDEAAFEDVDFDRLRTDFELRNFLPVRAPDEDRIEGTAEWMRDKGFVAEGADIDTVEADDEARDEDEAEATAD